MTIIIFDTDMKIQSMLDGDFTLVRLSERCFVSEIKF